MNSEDPRDFRKKADSRITTPEWLVIIAAVIVLGGVAFLVTGCRMSLLELDPTGALGATDGSGGSSLPATALDWGEPSQWGPYAGVTLLVAIAGLVNRVMDRRDRRKFHGKDAA